MCDELHEWLAGILVSGCLADYGACQTAFSCAEQPSAEEDCMSGRAALVGYQCACR